MKNNRCIFFDGISFKEFKNIDFIDKKYHKVGDIKYLFIHISVILCDLDILNTGIKDFEDIKIDKSLILHQQNITT